VDGVVIYASGFAVTGKQEKTAAQSEIARLAAAYGVRVVGPNYVTWSTLSAAQAYT
jgi:acetyl-CoA synthetase/acetyltransferase